MVGKAAVFFFCFFVFGFVFVFLVSNNIALCRRTNHSFWKLCGLAYSSEHGNRMDDRPGFAQAPSSDVTCKFCGKVYFSYPWLRGGRATPRLSDFRQQQCIACLILWAYQALLLLNLVLAEMLGCLEGPTWWLSWACLATSMATFM